MDSYQSKLASGRLSTAFGIAFDVVLAVLLLLPTTLVMVLILPFALFAFAIPVISDPSAPDYWQGLSLVSLYVAAVIGLLTAIRLAFVHRSRSLKTISLRMWVGLFMGYAACLLMQLAGFPAPTPGVNWVLGGLGPAVYGVVVLVRMWIRDRQQGIATL